MHPALPGTCMSFARTRSRSVIDDRRIGLTETCQDIVGDPQSENPFIHAKHEIKGHRLYGKVRNTIFNGDPGPRSVTSYSNFAIPALPESDASATTRFLAGTLPSRTEFNALSFIGELKDVPELIRYGGDLARFLQRLLADKARSGQQGPTLSRGLSPEWLRKQYGPSFATGLSLTKQLAMANLALQFGVAPFVSDVLKMTGLITAIEKRRKELDQLHRTGRKSGRWELGSTSSSGVDTAFTQLGNALVEITITAERKRWGTTTWFVKDPSYLPKTDADLYRQMLGLTVPGLIEAAWQLLPWSWLIDYFSNVGDALSLSANSGLYGCKGSLMTEARIKARLGFAVRVDIPTLVNQECSAGEINHLSQLRTPIVKLPGPTTSFDILSGKQLSILGSLATIKALR